MSELLTVWWRIVASLHTGPRFTGSCGMNESKNTLTFCLHQRLSGCQPVPMMRALSLWLRSGTSWQCFETRVKSWERNHIIYGELRGQINFFRVLLKLRLNSQPVSWVEWFIRLKLAMIKMPAPWSLSSSRLSKLPRDVICIRVLPGIRLKRVHTVTVGFPEPGLQILISLQLTTA